jgi:hypothetical protein
MERMETEKLLLINSYASSIGYRPHELPFRDVPVLTVSKDKTHREYMGFAYMLPNMHEVSNPVQQVGGNQSTTSIEDNVEDDEAIIEEAEEDETPSNLDT